MLKVGLDRLKKFNDNIKKGALQLFNFSPKLQQEIFDKDKEYYNKFVKGYIQYLNDLVKNTEERNKQLVEELKRSTRPEDKALIKYYDNFDYESLKADKINDLSRYSQNKLAEFDPKIKNIKGVNIKEYKPKKEKVKKEKVKKEKKQRKKKLKMHLNEDGEERPDGALSDEDAEEEAYNINEEIEEIKENRDLSDNEVDQKIGELIDKQTDQVKWYLKNMFNIE